MEEAISSLLYLPDDVICVLLRYLDATSLYLLGRTCTHLDELIKNHITLWRRVDARRSPNDLRKVVYCLKRCYDQGTHTLLLRADDQYEPIVPDYFFTKINGFSRLTVLALENLSIDGYKYHVTSLPGNLQELSLKRSSVTNPIEFLKSSGTHFPHLRVLILDQCDWIHSSAFLSISKYNSLEILSVYKCQNVDNMIAYLSLASLGFKSLKIIDARLTPFGSTLIQAMYRIPTLLAIYLQHYVTYKLDYLKRKLEILKGAPLRDFYVMESDEFESATENDVCWGDHSTLDDTALIDYLSVHSTDKLIEFPVSVLYLDPFNQCTCGFDTKKNPAPPNDPSNDDPRLRTISDRIDNLSSWKHNRSYCNRRERPPSPVHTFEVIISNSRVRIHDPDEPPRKRARTEDSAGPSGLNRNSDSEDEAPVPVRPPTPHPDSDEGNVFFRINWRDTINIQIENANEIHKNLKVPLRRLSLRGYKKITNVALNYIKNLDLEVLDLTYTSVTVEAIRLFLKSHPLCRIVHEKFCTCPTNLHF